MAKKKEFTVEKYEEIKNLLSTNKITSHDLDCYIKTKALRYERYQELNEYTDEQILDIVNDKLETEEL